MQSVNDILLVSISDVLLITTPHNHWNDGNEGSGGGSGGDIKTLMQCNCVRFYIKLQLS